LSSVTTGLRHRFHSQRCWCPRRQQPSPPPFRLRSRKRSTCCAFCSALRFPEPSARPSVAAGVGKRVIAVRLQRPHPPRASSCSTPPVIDLAASKSKHSVNVHSWERAPSASPVEIVR
jgi:hypothetical protein